jgi:hypothetical protein
MSHSTGIDRRPGDNRFGAATPGVRAEQAGIGDLVTASARRRRRVITPWRLTALVAALLVAGGSYALGRYVTAPKVPPTAPVAVTAVALPAGARLTASDIRIVTVQATGLPTGYLSPEAAVGVLGLVTRQALPVGTFIASSMLSPSGGLPGPSQALVGLDLKAGQLPAGGLVIGQRVLVVLLPVSSQGVARDQHDGLGQPTAGDVRRSTGQRHRADVGGDRTRQLRGAGRGQPGGDRGTADASDDARAPAQSQAS